jgi:glycosyltransferase involved in cell wall biosynthesis
MLLSIIIPMYKVAPYVERCIRSLSNQDISHELYEIICVNDGSPDSCAEIVTNLHHEIPNLVLINQDNQGVSMARNNALAMAKGKYMMPVDPDDYVIPNCLKRVIDQAETNELEVLYCAFEIFDVNHVSTWRTNYASLIDRVDNGYDGYFAVRGAKVKDPDRSVAILFQMDLLRKYQIDYPQKVPFLEDGLFLGKVFAVAERVGYSNERFYQRTTRAGSATNSKLNVSDKALQGYIISIDSILSFQKSISNTIQATKIINFILSQYTLLYLFALISFSNKKKYLDSLNELSKRGCMYLNLNGVTQSHKNYLAVFFLHPLLLYYLRRPIFHFNKLLNL